MTTPPPIDDGNQGKHVVGHNNYVPARGRSILTADPHGLAGHAGTGSPINAVPAGQPGHRERIDFGRVIGEHLERPDASGQPGRRTPTTVGIIHYGKRGIHIVPGRPRTS